MASPLYLPFRFVFGVAAGNHAITQRIAYTVPAGKIAAIQHMYINLESAAAPAIGTALLACRVNGVDMAYVLANGVVGQQYWNIPTELDLIAADLVEISTQNASGIVLAFRGAFQIREYQ